MERKTKPASYLGRGWRGKQERRGEFQLVIDAVLFCFGHAKQLAVS